MRNGSLGSSPPYLFTLAKGNTFRVGRNGAQPFLQVSSRGQISGPVINLTVHVVPQRLGSGLAINRFQLGEGLIGSPTVLPHPARLSHLRLRPQVISPSQDLP